MRIDQLDLRNIMGLERFLANFAPGFNVIIGDNGAGKSSILKILARILSQWTPEPEPVFRSEDRRERVETQEGNAFRKLLGDSIIGVHGSGIEGDYFATVEGDKTEPFLGPSYNVTGRATRHLKAADRDPTIPLPLMVLSPPWREPPRKAKQRKRYEGPKLRTEGYAGAFDLKADFTEFAAWFKAMEQARQDREVAQPSLEATRSVLIQSLPDTKDIRFYPDLNDIYVTFSDGHAEPIWRLSDGYRTLLALVGELAWRAVILNPTLGAEVNTRIEGVVLIDELDLHLHPLWQRRVAADLRRAFPKVQFIATTHSPFIVQSMEAHEVINLDRATSLDYQRASIEDIAEVEMGVTSVQRSKVFHEKVEAARAYLQALEHRPSDAVELTRLKAHLDDIQTQFGSDPVYVASLLQKRAARGLE